MSKIGIAASSLYVLFALVVFVAHLYSVETNPADSGESRIPFFMLTLPWMMYIPSSWHYSSAWSLFAYPISWICIALNALLIYGIVALSTSIVRRLWKDVWHVIHHR